MLQQTQVATVIPYYERWLALFPSFAALAAADEDAVLGAWQGLGYYSRARNLHRAAQQVVVELGGALPPDAGAIQRLPGVGRYTAGAIASFAFDLPVAAIDANIARVLARLLDLQLPVDSTAGAAKLWHAAEALLPNSGGGLHTSSLMELGALICTTARPKCLICPVREWCAAEDPELLPQKKPRRKLVQLEENCGWVVDGDRILLERQTGRRWRGLWKLPLLENLSTRRVVEDSPLLQITYPFTHHQVTLAVCPAAVPVELSGDQQWFPRSAGDLPAMPSPHRRAAVQMLKRG